MISYHGTMRLFPRKLILFFNHEIHSNYTHNLQYYNVIRQNKYPWPDIQYTYPRVSRDVVLLFRVRVCVIDNPPQSILPAGYVGTVNGTDIYYSTWSLENVSKSCQFQFFRPPPKQTLTIFQGGIRKIF